MKSARNLLLLAGSLIVTLVAIELALRLAPSRWVAPHGSLWQLAMYEGFHFHHARKPAPETPKSFHPVRGWTDFTIRADGDRYVIEDVPGSAWRPPQAVARAKTKTRVVLIGDSFVYGWEVGKGETIDSYLQARLGDGFEVVNLGVRAYAIDQMTLLAAEIVPQLSPDIVVVAFIAGDLGRSCSRFSPLAGGAAKPKFEIGDGQLVQLPIVLPTPYQAYLQHRPTQQRVLDFLAAKLYSARTVGLLMEPFLRPAWDRCVTELNARLLGDLAAKLRPATRLIYWHLDGALPDRFVANMRKLGVGYLSAPPEVHTVARELGLSPDRHEDGHPKGPLNRIYAFLIHRSIVDRSAK